MSSRGLCSLPPQSGLGAGLAQQIQPLTDSERIEQLLAETGELKRLLEPDRSLPLGGLHDLSPLLHRLDQGEEIFTHRRSCATSSNR